MDRKSIENISYPMLDGCKSIIWKPKKLQVKDCSERLLSMLLYSIFKISDQTGIGSYKWCEHSKSNVVNSTEKIYKQVLLIH